MFLISSLSNHVSSEVVNEFEDEIRRKLSVVNKQSHYNRINKIQYFIYKCFRKIGIDIIPTAASCHLSNPLYDNKHLFSIMMGLDEMKWRSAGLLSRHTKSIYLFDAWPSDYKKIIVFCNKYKINYLFVTSVQSSLRLKDCLSHTKVFYIPEAIAVNQYQALPFGQKDIDVLAIGRKWDSHHNQIANKLYSSGINYLYETQKGKVIFPNRESFIKGLARTKISICVPSNITHPQRAGDVETMTARYLQSMASRCLVLGIAPKEMINLFGYNPVITIDINHPFEQILDILIHFSDYSDLIEKNYLVVINNHDWKNRIENMIDIWNRPQNTN